MVRQRPAARHALHVRLSSTTTQARKLGHIRKTFPNPGWLGFSFRVQGKLAVLHEPARARSEEAEDDRNFIAASIERAARSSRVDAGPHAIRMLCDGKKNTISRSAKLSQLLSRSVWITVVPEICNALKKKEL